MKSSLRWFTLAVCSTLAVTGCNKKETAETTVARDAENKLPTPEQVEPAPDAAPGSAPGESGSPIPGATTAAPGAGGAMPAPAGGEQAAYEAWFKKHNLDLSDSKMLDADPDEDGFSNRDEFLADTDPHDKNSRPGIHKSIRMKEYNEVRLPLVLESIEGDKAHIRRTDQPEAKPQVVKVGDSVKGLPSLKVVHVEEKQDIDKGGERYDGSQVALEDSATKEKVVLMKDLPARTSATYALLVSPDGKTSMKVHKGDVFTWPAENAAQYKVMDLSQDQVVLLQVDTKKTWTIPRM